MNGYRIALGTEWLKFRSALLPRVATVMLIAGVAAICASFMSVSLQPDSIFAAKLGALLTEGGFAGLFGLAGQVLAVAGVLGFGIVLAWMFGREFADGTIAGLFALPVSRGVIAAAKLSVYAAWAIATSFSVVLALLPTGALLGFGFTPQLVALGTKLLTIGVLTPLLAAIGGLAATLGRGYLAGIGVLAAAVVVAQVAAVTGLGAWFPLAAPGLWAGSNGAAASEAVSAIQLLLVVPVAALCAALTIAAWRRLQLA